MSEPPELPDAPERPSMPRWVKISAVAVGVLVLLFILLHLTGVISGHGPGQHTSAGAGRADAPTQVVRRA